MNSSTGLRFLVTRKDLHRTRVTTDPDAPDARPLQDGEARLCIDRFALTANNITYAAFGDAMKYWDFFPVEDAAWGCVPVWGFATVLESRAAGIETGRRVYGFLPMGTHLVVQPGQVSTGGFSDIAAHRRELAPVYNRLVWCDADPGYVAAREAEQAVLRPLFTTSFLIDDFFAEAGFFGAGQVILSSASSKTAYGTAHCLSLRRGKPGAPRIIGLTSRGHLEYVRSLGCYDTVLSYDDLDQLDSAIPSAYIDFAGNAALRRTIHGQFLDRLLYSCSVGGTHWGEIGSGGGLPGPRPTLFFAPGQIKKRSAAPPEGWGAQELQRRLGVASAAFVARVSDPAQPWLRIVEWHGADGIETAFAAQRDGRVDAREGLILAW